MGHRTLGNAEADYPVSPGWQDAEWLGKRIRLLMASTDFRGQEHFCLLGTRTDVRLELWPEEGGESSRRLVCSFRQTEDHQIPAPYDAMVVVPDKKSLEAFRVKLNRIRKRALDAGRRERVLVVRNGEAASRLQYPKTWRRATRPMLRIARHFQSGKNPALPFLARNRELYIEEKTPEDDVTIQLLTINHQWGLAEFTEIDQQRLIRYLCSLWDKPGIFVVAAETAIPTILANWVIPQHANDFRRYAKQTVWAYYAKDERVPLIRRPLEEPSENLPSEEWADIKSEAEKAGQPIKSRVPAQDFTVVALAQMAAMDPRRVYEAIRVGKLHAKKVGARLRVSKQDAREFCLRSLGKRTVRESARELVQAGKGQEATRKLVYRLRKSGLTNGEIVSRINVEIKKYRPATRKR
jgi:hypothetical protein